MTLTTEAITCLFGWIPPPDRDSALKVCEQWKKGGEKPIVWQMLVRNFFGWDLQADEAKKFIEAHFPTGWAKKLEIPFSDSPTLPILNALPGTPDLVLTISDGMGKAAMFNCALKRKSCCYTHDSDANIEATGGWSAWFQAWDDGSITRVDPQGNAELLTEGIDTPIDQIGQFAKCTDALAVGEGQLLWLPAGDGVVRNLPQIRLPKRFALAHTDGHTVIGTARGIQLVRCREGCKAGIQLWKENMRAPVTFIRTEKTLMLVTAKGSSLTLHDNEPVHFELGKGFTADFIQSSELLPGKVLVTSTTGQLALIDVLNRRRCWEWKGCGSPIQKLEVSTRKGAPLLYVQTGTQLGVMDVTLGYTLRIFKSQGFTASNNQVAFATGSNENRRIEVY